MLTVSRANASIVFIDIADTALASLGTIDINFDGAGDVEFSIADQSFGDDTVEPGIFFNADVGFVMVGTPPPATE